MHYMFLIYSRENEMRNMSPDQAERIWHQHQGVMDDAQRRGVFHGAAPLQPTSVATTVRMQTGKALTTDGPFADTKEQLAGYYILDCQDLDEAIAWAARIPTGCAGGDGCIEIRPLRQMSTTAASSLTSPDRDRKVNG